MYTALWNNAKTTMDMNNIYAVSVTCTYSKQAFIFLEYIIGLWYIEYTS